MPKFANLPVMPIHTYSYAYTWHSQLPSYYSLLVSLFLPKGLGLDTAVYT